MSWVGVPRKLPLRGLPYPWEVGRGAPLGSWERAREAGAGCGGVTRNAVAPEASRESSGAGIALQSRPELRPGLPTGPRPSAECRCRQDEGLVLGEAAPLQGGQLSSKDTAVAAGVGPSELRKGAGQCSGPPHTHKRSRAATPANALGTHNHQASQGVWGGKETSPAYLFHKWWGDH